MPIALHIDHDVPIAVSRELRSLMDGQGMPCYVVETARSLGMTAAPDYDHLLHATQHGRVFITCNWRDFQLLHGAWKHWSQIWGVRHQHAPILVISQQISPQQASALVDQQIRSGVILPNELHRYHPKVGWRQYS